MSYPDIIRELLVGHSLEGVSDASLCLCQDGVTGVHKMYLVLCLGCHLRIHVEVQLSMKCTTLQEATHGPAH